MALLAGTLEYTGNRVDDRGDNAIMLLDLYRFVKRDHDVVPSAKSQVLGPLDLNVGSATGRFMLRLPAVPGERAALLPESWPRRRVP